MKNLGSVHEADPVAERSLDPDKAVHGKYYDRMQQGSNVVLIAPDLLESFPTEESVNEALRSLQKVAARTAKRA